MLNLSELQSKIARFETYLASDPDNCNLLIDLGDAYHRAGDFPKALSCFERVITLKPGSAIGRSRRAAVYLSQHRFADAELELAGIIAGGVTDPALQHNLGLALYHQRNFDAAQLRFLAAAQSGFSYAGNWKHLAYSLHHLGQLDEAIDAAEKWAATDGSTDSRGFLALLHFDLGDQVRAGAIAQQVLLEDLDNTDANEVIASLAMETQDMALARDTYARMIVQAPDYGRGWLGHGLSLLHEEDRSGAVAALSTAAEKMPGHAGTLVALGWSHFIAEDFNKAEQVFRDAIALDRNFAESHGGRASALVHLHRIEEAKQAISLADKLDTANFGAVYAKAALLQLEGRSALADRLIDRALHSTPIAGGKPLIESLSRLKSGR